MMVKFNIPTDAKRIISTLERQGFRAYVVGGCVRDTLMGKLPHDWDICTNATPKQVIDAFPDVHIEKTGIKHGTVSLFFSDRTWGAYEVTTFRTEGKYSDGRRPDKVKYVKNVEEDLSRRDFTMNAIAYNPVEGLVDPFGGVKDIEARVIRCVGKPEHRFEEDSLRMMRAVRFQATLGFIIEENTFEAIKALRGRIKRVSGERIGDEFIKTLNGKFCALALNGNRELLCQVIPEFYSEIDFNQRNPWHDKDLFAHTMCALAAAVARETDVYVRAALLLHDIAKPLCVETDANGINHYPAHPKQSAELAELRMRNMKLSNNFVSKVRELILFHDADIPATKPSVRRWIGKLGVEQFRRLLTVQRCDHEAQNLAYSGAELAKLNKISKLLDIVLDEENCFKVKDLAVSGQDIMALGVPQGPEIGRILELLLQAVISEEVENEKSELLRKAREFIGKGLL